MERVEASQLDALPEILERAGRCRPLLLCGPTRRHVDRALSLLATFETAVFDGARRHVPEAVVDAADRALEDLGADAVVALGGGSPIGLGKALRLRRSVYFVAVPTTYAGSEMTTIFGTTRDGKKSTGRDPRVRPDAVIYDVELTLDMPLGLTVTSLLNALAHPLSVMSAGPLEPVLSERALVAVETLLGALETLARSPEDRVARRDALRGAGLAAQVLDAGRPGLHHRLAHRLGGRFDVDHGGLHSVLLPHSVARLREEAPRAWREIEARLGRSDLPTRLFDVLRDAGAPTSLRALGVTPEAWQRFLEEEPDLPRELLADAFAGERPGAG